MVLKELGQWFAWLQHLFAWEYLDICSHMPFYIYLDIPQHIQAMWGGGEGYGRCCGWQWGKNLSLGSCFRGAAPQECRGMAG